MEIRKMKVNHLENPVGYALDRILFSWIANGSEKKNGVRVMIAEDADFEKILSDSGYRKDIDGIGYPVRMELKPRTRYYWKVQIQDYEGRVTEKNAFFETGKMEEAWNAQWITAPFREPSYLCREFVAEQIEDATLYVMCRGLMEIYVNGQRVGEDYLDPGYSSYDLWEQVHTVKIGDYLQEGKNVIGFALGDGWYRGRLGYDGLYENNYGDRLMIMGELHLTDCNGNHTVIGTDDIFVSKKSPIRKTNIYDGEVYDAREETEHWCEESCDRSTWVPVTCCGSCTNGTKDRLRLPIRKQEVFTPMILYSPIGETILDFGQNMAGWVEGDVHLSKDACLELFYGEILQNDCFYNENLRTAKEKYTFYSKGEKAHIRPYFTYYGFRYVKVVGEITEEELKSFRAYALYSDMDETCEVQTSNELVNRFISNVKWGQKGNFLDVPTDCPQRDERLGWTGDTQIFAATASYNMDTCAFYTKHMKDLRLEQEKLDGGIPFVVPYLKTVSATSGLRRHSSCAWGDIATVLPWTMYLYYSDRGLLEEYYPMMKDWVGYIKQLDEESGARRLWTQGFHFADWLALDNYRNPDSPMGGTDPYYVASAWYAYSVHLTAKAAEVLGKTEESSYYAGLFEEIRQAIQKEYFTESGRCAIPTQTAKVLALQMELVPQQMRKRVAEDLVQQIRENDMKLETGFCGTPFLLKVLSDMEYDQEAYTLFLNEDIPGWLYEVRMGATTVWERWDSVMPDRSMNPKGMNSLNHYAYGAVMEWFYRVVCGIRVREKEPGFRKIDLKPRPDRRLSWVNCTVDTVAGTYHSEWKITGDKIMYQFEIPTDREAFLTLPGEAPVVLQAGTYCFERAFKE